MDLRRPVKSKIELIDPAAPDELVEIASVEQRAVGDDRRMVFDSVFFRGDDEAFR